MAKRGRPSTYDFELAEEICLKVADGVNVKTVLKSDDRYPSFPTWCKWKRENPELLNLYVNSLQDKAESGDEELDQIKDMLKSGKIDAATANVLIQLLKWKLSKYYPKMFGDKQSIDHTTDGKPINSEPIKIVFDNSQESKND